MSNPGSPQPLTPEHPTRQQLDELDALLQRMLALPVNPAEGEQARPVEPAPPPPGNEPQPPPVAERAVPPPKGAAAEPATVLRGPTMAPAKPATASPAKPAAELLPLPPVLWRALLW